MAYTERDILGNAGALRVAIMTLVTMPQVPPKDEKAKKEYETTMANMKETIEKTSEILIGGLLNDMNRIANALEELVRLKHEEGRNEYAGK